MDRTSGAAFIELDVATMLGRAPPTLFAPRRVNGHGWQFPVAPGAVRAVFAKNQLLGEYGVAVNRDVDLREIYDQEDPFQLAPYYLGA